MSDRHRPPASNAHEQAICTIAPTNTYRSVDIPIRRSGPTVRIAMVTLHDHLSRFIGEVKHRRVAGAMAGPAFPGPQPDPRGAMSDQHPQPSPSSSRRSPSRNGRPGWVPGRLHRSDPRGVCAGPAPVRRLVPAAAHPPIQARHADIECFARDMEAAAAPGPPSPAACAPSPGSTNTPSRKSCSTILRPVAPSVTARHRRGPLARRGRIRHAC